MVVQKSLSSFSRVRFRGYLRCGWVEMSPMDGYDKELVKTWCFMHAAQNFRQHDPNLWEKFQKNEPVVPHILFKIELRNCGSIGAGIRNKLALYIT
jgi:hypothetical protein